MNPERDFDFLDAVVHEVANCKLSTYSTLSTGERIYVALAASRPDLIIQEKKTMPWAIARLDDGWLQELIARWQHRAPTQSAPFVNGAVQPRP